MRKRRLVVVAVFALGSSVAAQDAPAPVSPAARGDDVPGDLPPDAFAQALADAKRSLAELGFRPLGSWPRYPTTVPYRLPFFDDLLARPLDTYEFTRTLGNAVEDLLTPERLTTAPEKDKPESLFPLAVALATDRRLGGMRGFGFGLLKEASPEEPELMAAEGLPTGNSERLSALGIAIPLARLQVGLARARLSIERGLRNVSQAERESAWARLPSFVRNLSDGAEDVTAWEDVVAHVDAMSLAYGSLQALAAVQRARRELAAAMPRGGKGDARGGWGDIDVDVPGIRIVSRADRQPIDLTFEAAPRLLLCLTPIRSVSTAGTTSTTVPLSVALFMDGVERVGSMPAGDVQPRPGGVASGILGCGIVYVAGNGSTTYEAHSHALGAGVLGMGILVDEGGDDVYRVREFGQGAGVFGAGLLLDAAGDDRYSLLSGDGQGLGGPGGIGVLADRSGDDSYYAEPIPEKAGKERADYHSDQKIVVSNAQGVGAGRRGDVSDGHAWAGGLGALIDVDGNDRYEAGNFSQGVGYWFGTGLLWDGGGDDVYRSVYFSHGSGAHFAIGAVVDEGGNDEHVLSDFANVSLGAKAGAGIAFGWDVVNAFVFERAGNDRYDADIISLGVSNVRSNAFLLDESGDDVYVAREAALALGGIDEMPTYVTPHRTSPFAFHLEQTAVFLDLHGVDRYLRRRNGGGPPIADAIAGDDRTWGREAPHGPGGGRNVSIARDVARGRLGFLDAWPSRVAPPRVAPEKASKRK